MDILHAIGCVCALGLATCAAIPIGSLCASIGFTGFAALAGAAAVVAIVQ